MFLTTMKDFKKNAGNVADFIQDQVAIMEMEERRTIKV